MVMKRQSQGCLLEPAKWLSSDSNAAQHPESGSRRDVVMTLFLIGQQPSFYADAAAVLSIAFGVIALGHALLGLLRNLRRFRNGN